MKNVVPILITWDVDPVGLEKNQMAIARIAKMVQDFSIQSTFFFPAKIAETLHTQVVELLEAGHEIGCHGLTHGYEEEYNRMSQEQQQNYLSKATGILEGIANCQIKSFRGPRAKTSYITQGILESLGYWCDSSIASQRLDFVSSNLINLGWLYASRLPYHPARHNPFKVGDRNLWVVPISALGVPFISSALYVFRLRFMKSFFKVLYRESQRTGKPIVYLAHPYEFAPPDTVRRSPPLGITRIQYVLIRGLRVRYRFYEQDREKRFNMTKSLFQYMTSFKDVQFMSTAEYVSKTLNKAF